MRFRVGFRCFVLAGTMLTGWFSALDIRAQCPHEWSRRFGGPYLSENYAEVFAMKVFDDGGGPALFVGGQVFSSLPVNMWAIAKWDGREWSALGQGMSQSSMVTCMEVFNDGSGPSSLYVGGELGVAGCSDCWTIARWDGNQWHGASPPGAYAVRSLKVLNDGTGPALFAATGDRVLKLTKDGWQQLGPNTDLPVYSLASFNDGNGPRLYAGGEFHHIGSQDIKKVAKWDGVQWTRVGTNGPDREIHALAVFDDGTGTKLYAGGLFTHFNGLARLSRWDGTSWSSAANGLSSSVESLYVSQSLGTPALFAGGLAYTGQVNLARWTGSTWVPAGGGSLVQSATVYSLAEYDDGGGSQLHAGGTFTAVGLPGGHYLPSTGIARLENNFWRPLGQNLNPGGVRALASYDDGTGLAVFVGGGFVTAGGAWCNGLAKWDGNKWQPIAKLRSLPLISSMCVFNPGDRERLYVAGIFDPTGGTPTPRIASWDGSEWDTLPARVQPGTWSPMTVFNDGSGPALYANVMYDGQFRIGRWDGASWSFLGGIPEAGVLAVYDDGAGPALYVGGFSLGRWTEHPISPGIQQGTEWVWETLTPLNWNGVINALTVFDDGSGPSLYVAGEFDSVGRLTAASVARWNSSGWSGLNGNLENWGYGPIVNHLAPYDPDDDGPNQPYLIAAGWIGSANYYGIAKWDGTSWTGLGGGGTNGINALLPFASSKHHSLFIGGTFTNVGDSIRSPGIAEWKPVAACGSEGIVPIKISRPSALTATQK